MFGFMKKHTDKDRDEKEKRKRDKKDKKKKDISKPLTSEELQRLDEAKKGLLQQASGSSDSLGSTPRQLTPDEATQVFTSTAKVDIGKTVRVPPAVQPKPTKGILKDKSHYGPEIPNQGVRGNIDDTLTLEENTMGNELFVEGEQKGFSGKPRSVKSLIGNFDVTPQTRTGPPKKPVSLSQPRSLHKVQQVPTVIEPPPEFQSDDHLDEEIPVAPPSPAEKIYENVELLLPHLAPPRSLKPRTLTVRRLPAGHFGFSLRKGTVLERAISDNVEKKRSVIFAEPGSKHMSSGLLPGDRLLEVNGTNVESLTREELIELIRKSEDTITLKVQPIPELSELSMRSGLEGQEVHIAEQSVKTGTLQRSGSMRFKSKQARSDEQLASDKAWLQAEQVWLIHKGGFAAAKLLRDALQEGGAGETTGEGKCRVKLENSGQVLEVEEEDVEKANPPQYDRVEDLCNLRYLNESSVLHTIRQRYASNLIHTYLGRSLLVVNPMHPLSIYSEKVIHMFRGCKPEDMPPHIYATAQTAYRDMLTSRTDQSIVLLGRSGGGKSTNVRHLIHYFVVASGCVGGVLTVEKLNAMFTLLDAFGNSRTIVNTSASRYTSLTSLNFDHSGQVASASVQVMMLEKTRITRRPEGEPTFHVFYQMLAGIDSLLRKELLLDNLTEPNLFMTPLQRSEDRQKATQAWAKIHHSMGVLGIKEEESKALYHVLSAVYHLGVAGVTKGTSNKYQFSKPGAAQKAASVLGVSTEELSRAIFSPAVMVQSPSPLRGDKGSSDVMTGSEALEGFVVGLYTEVFNVLVALINRSLTSNYRSNTSILILDSPGFQNPKSCGHEGGASFEDLCHNYLQERLQLLYHEDTFTSQQDLYAQESVDVDFDIVSTSPQSMVTLIDQPSQQSLVRGNTPTKRDGDQKGLLWILDEEAIYPGSTDQMFTERVYAVNMEKAKLTLLKKTSNKMSFTLNHCQGTNPVTYNTSGWLKACRENPVTKNVIGFLLDSHSESLTTVFSTFRAAGVPTTFSGSIVGLEGTGSLRRTSSMRRNFTSGAAGIKRKSVCLQVKYHTDSIVDSLRRCRLHFVHCLLPQHNAGLSDLRTSQLAPNKSVSSEEALLNVPLLRRQVRGQEIVEGIRIHRQGFPEHILYSEFLKRYQMLSPPEARPGQGITVEDKQAVEKILVSVEVEKAAYRTGLSQVFFRAGWLTQLENSREEKITGTLVKIQTYSRGWLSRKRLHQLKLQHTAVACIQRNVNKFMAIREWPWWKLYTKVRPLLNVHRTEEELLQKEMELEQLRARFDKLEKERNDYKQTSDRLETKLTEVTVDLSEEHLTSNQASEILEVEQSERRRLEKELKDITGKHTALLRKHEMTEIDLYQARMLAAQLDGEIEEDDVDGDSIYRDRYEKLRRESEFTKQKIERENEEEIGRYEHLKKQLEKRLAEALEEADEQRHQMSNWKKKAQRLQQELADNKLHLEEQLTRNSDLEKRQRRFDNELLKVTEQMKDEKVSKERLQRERDGMSTERFGVEQQYKNLKVDFDIQSEKVSRLEAELDELSTIKKDDHEVMSLKRSKNELDRKLQEQEEELDEQAGSIQQLEQAKLRLEMAQENLRKQHLRDLEEKEQELEDMRANTQKKVKAMEKQVEEEYEDKQRLMKEKREVERKLSEMSDIQPTRDKDTERRLRRDLKRTKALLHDTQLVLDKQREAGSRATVKQLRNQLEDSEYAVSAAVKARKSVEMELQDVQQQLDDLSKAKQEADSRCMSITRDKTDLTAKLEEIEEDMNEIMKKYKVAVQQQSTSQIMIDDQSRQIEELTLDNQSLKEKVLELESRVQFCQDNMVDKEVKVRLEVKVRELDAKVQLEETSKLKAENQVSRLKDQLESVTDDRDRMSSDHQRYQENQRRVDRQVREAHDEVADLERKESETGQRKVELEKKVESLDSELDQSRSDLRLAFKRISDLQAVIEDQMKSDSDSDELGDISEDTEDSDDDFMDLVNHRGGHTALSNNVSPRLPTHMPRSADVLSKETVV